MPENVTMLVGNLTDDPELRYTANGTPVANFRLAVNRRVRENDGGWRDAEATFIPVNVWRDMAENVAESLHRGDRAVVAGRLRTRSWETDAGARRSVTELDAQEVAPSLRWHVVKGIEKPERTRDAGRDAPGRDDDVPF